MDIEHIKHLPAERLTKETVEKKASDFLSKYYPEYNFEINPCVPIEDIIDLRLRFKLVEWDGLQSKNKYGVDAFLSYSSIPERCEIHFDSQYSRPGATLTRYRFTIAHEVGHWYMHDYIYGCVFPADSIFDAVERIGAISEECHKWLNKQAHWFASYVLMPNEAVVHVFKKLLSEHTQTISSIIEAEKGEDSQKKAVKDFLAEKLGQEFDVSPIVAKIAIERDRECDLVDMFWSQIP